MRTAKSRNSYEENAVRMDENEMNRRRPNY